jgi:hypothetical protein
MFSTHLRLRVRGGPFPSCFPTNNLYAVLFYSIRATCLTQLILHDLTILITFGEEYKSCCSSLCSFLHPPVTLSLIGSKIRLNHPQSMENAVLCMLRRVAPVTTFL